MIKALIYFLHLSKEISNKPLLSLVKLANHFRELYFGEIFVAVIVKLIRQLKFVSKSYIVKFLELNDMRLSSKRTQHVTVNFWKFSGRLLI